jgi:hypothetical protein
VIRNILIGILAVMAVFFGYRCYQLAAEANKQAQLQIETREKAVRDLQSQTKSLQTRSGAASLKDANRPEN